MIVYQQAAKFKLGKFLIILFFLIFLFSLLIAFYFFYRRSNLFWPLAPYYQLITRPEKIDLQIDFADWQKIEAKRQAALATGVLISSDQDYVNASLAYQGQTIPIKLRLKGDWTDHLQGKKWSLRIKTKKNHSFKGMTVFSLQEPRTRHLMHEWFAQKIFSQEGLIGLRYQFIQVAINGQDKGIFALEEHFTQELLANNARRQAVILKFDESQIWQNMTLYGPEELPEDLIDRASIDSFEIPKILNNPALLKQYQHAAYLLEQYRQAKKAPAEIFDLKLWAQAAALSDILGFRHGFKTHNLRFYYNPITGLLEPILFDLMAGQPISQLIIEEENFLSRYPALKNDSQFQGYYLQFLEQYSQADYIKQKFANYQEEIKHWENILRREYRYRFPTQAYLLNQKFIAKKLADQPALRAALTNEQRLEITPLTELPTQVRQLVDENGQVLIDWTKQKLIIPAADRLAVPSPQQISLDIPLDINLPQNYQLKYSFCGLNQIFTLPLQSWPVLENSPILSTKQTLPDFVIYNFKTQSYLIPPGKWQVKQLLMIPPGKKLIIAAGAELDLLNSSYIISYSPLEINGALEQPVKIYSSDQSGQGILVLKTDQPSQINYASFSNLAHIKNPALNITGSLSFYRADVNFSHCLITNNQAEDMLNIINSQFNLDQVIFDQAQADGLDSDFSYGQISNCQFKNLGNDAIDTSASFLTGENLTITNAQDKAVSVGEQSRVILNQTLIKNSRLGLVSKDSSELVAKSTQIEGGQYALAAYQKKATYSPASMKLTDFTSTALNNYILETGSTVSLDGSILPATEKSVYQQLYPLEN